MTKRVLGVSICMMILCSGINTFSAEKQQPPAKRTPRSVATRQPAAKPQMSGGLLQKIEAKTGKALPVDLRKELGQAGQTMASALKVAQGKFITAIAAASGVTEAQVAEMMPKVGEDNTGFDKNMIPKLEKILGRPLTSNELQQTRAADDAKKAAMKTIQEQFAAQAARLSGLKTEEILGMLPKIGL